MAPIFRLDLLPAREGDCLVLTYGDSDHPRRIMVDAGRKATYKAVRLWMDTLPAAERRFELLIVSHVDRDHIEGVVDMLADPTLPVRFRDIWFNGYHNLQDGDLEAFGPAQGERLSEMLRAPGVKWNGRFRRKSVELKRARKPITLPGGLKLTLLSPGRDQLKALIPEWDRECRKAGLIKDASGWHDPEPPGLERLGPINVAALAAVPFEPDPSKPNATSIAVIAEFAGRRVLLAADGGAELLADSLEPLASAEPSGRLPLAALKLPHHGSRYNLTTRLLDLIDCKRFLVSSNGTFFDHPHPEAIARILTHSVEPELVFNYRSPESSIWDDDDLRAAHRYRTTYPPASQDGTIAVDLLA